MYEIVPIYIGLHSYRLYEVIQGTLASWYVQIHKATTLIIIVFIYSIRKETYTFVINKV